MVARRQDEPTVIRGVRIREEASVPTYRAGRVCRDLECDTVLSVYNSGAFCWQHEPPHRSVGAPAGRPRGDRALEEIGEGVWARSA